MGSPISRIRAERLDILIKTRGFDNVDMVSDRQFVELVKVYNLAIVGRGSIDGLFKLPDRISGGIRHNFKKIVYDVAETVINFQVADYVKRTGQVLPKDVPEFYFGLIEGWTRILTV